MARVKRSVVIGAAVAAPALVAVVAVSGPSAAQQARPASDVKVVNPIDSPVPVASSDKTELVAQADVDSSAPIIVDVSRYRALRFAASGHGCGDGGSNLIVSAIEDGRRYRVMQVELCRSGVGIVPTFQRELMASTLELPGRSIRIDVTSVGSVELAVFGRAS